MSPTALAQQLSDSAIGTALRESLFLFPLIEGLHLLGLALSFGLIFFTDLRLIGVFLPQVPVSQVLNQLRRWIFTGFALTFATGFLLFWAEADSMIRNPAFLIKSAAIVIALVNAAAFEIAWGKRGAAWVDQARAPLAARVAGWTSLSFWTAVTISGRLIPYYSA
ncbi:MAG: hypothetical protein JWR56_851 [Massilia sp.]|jgi:hypothetical protein|nr:hypothetical protein [Massilia sp.]